MTIVNIHQAKTNLSKLLDAVVHGEDVIIAKAGKPIAKLIAISTIAHERQAGALKGRIDIANDFDAPLSPDVLDDFEDRQ